MMAKEKRINRRALFADETQDYRIPEEPDSGEMTELRFRTGAGEAQQVFCVVMETGEHLEMKKMASDGRFDFFQTTMRVGDVPDFCGSLLQWRSGQRCEGAGVRLYRASGSQG